MTIYSFYQLEKLWNITFLKKIVIFNEIKFQAKEIVIASF